MNIEHIEIEHNKKITALFCLLIFIATVGLCAVIALVCVNFSKLSDSIGMGLTICMTILLSLCVLGLFILLINQVAKFRYNIIFIADENGICDYSRHVVLKRIAYSEIKSIEYKEFLSADVEASELRHLKIVLKDNRRYIRKLNFLQKISFFLGLNHIELHLFCGKIKLKDLAIKLKQNLEIYNQINDPENTF